MVHCKKENYDIYIGRGKDPKTGKIGIWGNPFVIGKDGERDFVILKYKLWLNTQPHLLREIHTLSGKILGCWCDTGVNCHGDILRELSVSKYVSNWFSNMLPMDKPFKYQGIEFNTVENFYQAMKLPKDRIDLRAKIASLNPYKAKTSIRDRKNYLWSEDWNQEKSLEVMEYILRFKFAKGTSWYNLLKMTEDWEITEWNNWNDKFWGKDLKTEEGLNNLGKILMRLRNTS